MSYIPTPEVYFDPEDGGKYEIVVGDQRGWVSSNHLIEPKTHQLQLAWCRVHQPPEQDSSTDAS